MTSEAVNHALEVMDRHINALNASDNEALISTLHFPQFRLNGTQLKTWESSEHYLTDFLQRAGSDWCYSRFEDIQVLQASDDKVHLDAKICRYRGNHSLITTFRSLWVITKVNGHWAAKFRSSFASI